MPMKFVRNPSFPASKCFSTEGGYFWKMVVREWAFVELDIEQTPAGMNATSNNPTVVPGIYDTDEKKVTTSMTGDKMTVRFFARSTGFSYVYPFRSDHFTAEEGIRMQVEVVPRKAAAGKLDVSLTKLGGLTVAINAPDAAVYEMDVNLAVPANAESIFDAVPQGADHVVIGSHAGVENPTQNRDVTKICLWLGGKSSSTQIDMTNATKVFQKLRGKVSPNCIVWMGGCNIGANLEFCKLASLASGCPVVAPELDLVATKYPKGFIDLLDRVAMMKVFRGA